jgi:hypothetical protein
LAVGSWQLAVGSWQLAIGNGQPERIARGGGVLPLRGLEGAGGPVSKDLEMCRIAPFCLQCPRCLYKMVTIKL